MECGIFACVFALLVANGLPIPPPKEPRVSLRTLMTEYPHPSAFLTKARKLLNIEQASDNTTRVWRHHPYGGGDPKSLPPRKAPRPHATPTFAPRHGIPNVGNTCWLGVALHAVLQLVVDRTTGRIGTPSTLCRPELMLNICNAMLLSQVPRQQVEAIRTFLAPRLDLRRGQHADAAEALLALLGLLPPPLQPAIEITSTVTSASCTSTEEERIFLLPLGCGFSTLQDAIDSFFAPEAVLMEHFSTTGAVTKKTQITMAPPSIALHVLRFNNEGDKLSNALALPTMIRLPGIAEPYYPVAAITHKGRSSRSGHYIALVRDGDQWMFYDDDKTRRLPDDHPTVRLVINEAYIIVLTQRSATCRELCGLDCCGICVNTTSSGVNRSPLGHFPNAVSARERPTPVTSQTTLVPREIIDVDEDINLTDLIRLKKGTVFSVSRRHLRKGAREVWHPIRGTCLEDFNSSSKCVRVKWADGSTGNFPLHGSTYNDFNIITPNPEAVTINESPTPTPTTVQVGKRRQQQVLTNPQSKKAAIHQPIAFPPNAIALESDADSEDTENNDMKGPGDLASPTPKNANGGLPTAQKCRSWYIFNGRPPHVAQIAWLALANESRKAHARWIRELRSMPADLLTLPISTAALELLQRMARARKWTWGTMARSMASVRGAVLALTMYTTEAEAVDLAQDPEWRAATRYAKRMEKETPCTPPPPLTFEQMQKARALLRHQPQAEMLLVLMWALAARASDVCGINAQDVHLKRPDRFSCTIRRGKGAKFRGPYPAATTLSPDDYGDLMKLLSQRRPDERLLTQQDALRNAVRKAIKEVAPGASLPSVRKGAARHMIECGMSEKAVMALLGHTRTDTFRRYLGYAEHLTREARRAQRQTRCLQEPAGHQEVDETDSEDE